MCKNCKSLRDRLVEAVRRLSNAPIPRIESVLDLDLWEEKYGDWWNSEAAPRHLKILESYATPERSPGDTDLGK